MRTPLSLLAAVLSALFLAACQTSSPSAPVEELPHGDPTAAESGLADSPQMGGSGSGATASGDPACMRGDQQCSTDHECCTGRCVQAGSTTGMCEQ